MIYDDLKALLDQKPFTPFSVHFADGDIVGVISREFVYLHPNRRTIIIAADTPGKIDVIAAIDLITRVSVENGFAMIQKVN